MTPATEKKDKAPRKRQEVNKKDGKVPKEQD